MIQFFIFFLFTHFAGAHTFIPIVKIPSDVYKTNQKMPIEVTLPDALIAEMGNSPNLDVKFLIDSKVVQLTKNPKNNTFSGYYILPEIARTDKPHLALEIKNLKNGEFFIYDDVPGFLSPKFQHNKTDQKPPQIKFQIQKAGLAKNGDHIIVLQYLISDKNFLNLTHHVYLDGVEGITEKNCQNDPRIKIYECTVEINLGKNIKSEKDKPLTATIVHSDSVGNELSEKVNLELLINSIMEPIVPIQFVPQTIVLTQCKNTSQLSFQFTGELKSNFASLYLAQNTERSLPGVDLKFQCKDHICQLTFPENCPKGNYRISMTGLNGTENKKNVYIEVKPSPSPECTHEILDSPTPEMPTQKTVTPLK